MPRPPAPLAQLRDLELLLIAHHPVIYLETIEEERAEVLLEHVADHLDLLYLTWAPGLGLQHRIAQPLRGTEEPVGCLDHILHAGGTSLYHLRAFVPLLAEPAVAAKLRDVHRKLWRSQGAVVLTGPGVEELPDGIGRLVTTVTLSPPSDLEYHRFVSDVLRDLRKRQPVKMQLTPQEVSQLIVQLRGLTFFEVKKVVTQAIAESWTLDRKVISKVLQVKKEVISRSGVLEYSPAEQTLSDIAGLGRLKSWLAKRKAAFINPEAARAFGLSAPKGILLLGVPGCGKSLSAKAVAREYGLPLIRLDPARLYTKYIGETEKNLRLAIRTAESMAPIVLWIDEIEKAFSPSSGGGDAGVSQRVFGTFLSWLQDKTAQIFVVATCNNVADLPPELLRKGRFDEIFFVDLPGAEARRQILTIHLERRQRQPQAFDLDPLIEESEGFSGAELEQAVVSALYAAYADGVELEAAHVLKEIEETRPLSVTMAEKIASLREWAAHRTVPAE